MRCCRLPMLQSACTLWSYKSKAGCSNLNNELQTGDKLKENKVSLKILGHQFLESLGPYEGNRTMFFCKTLAQVLCVGPKSPHFHPQPLPLSFLSSQICFCNWIFLALGCERLISQGHWNSNSRGQVIWKLGSSTILRWVQISVTFMRYCCHPTRWEKSHPTLWTWEWGDLGFSNLYPTCIYYKPRTSSNLGDFDLTFEVL